MKTLKTTAAYALAAAFTGVVHAADFNTESALAGLAACGDAFESATHAGTDCLEGKAVNDIVLSRAARFADAYGKSVFGQHFSLKQRLTYAPAGGGFSGEIDAVIPLVSGLADDGDVADAALFLQQGLTRWTDSAGFLRNDLRYGMAHRFDVANMPGADIVGISVFHQRNLEHGHGRLVTGVEYDGAWGDGALTYFKPTTGWRDSLADWNKEERALEGMEFALHFKPTSAIHLETAATHWEDTDGAKQWVTGGRMATNWQPHPWLHVGHSWDGLGTDNDNQSLHLTLSIPLEEADKIPEWQGLGIVGAAKQSGRDVWRAVEHVGRIEVAQRERRALATNPDGTVKGANVRFMQDYANSGEAIRAEVTLANTVGQDTRLELRLAPGAGDNPVVPGEDFIDEPVVVVVPKGETRAEVVIQLIRNPAMTSPRSLSAKVFLAAA